MVTRIWKGTHTAAIAFLGLLGIMAVFAGLVASPERACDASSGSALACAVHGARELAWVLVCVLGLALAGGSMLGLVTRRPDGLLARCVEVMGAYPTVILVAVVQAGLPGAGRLALILVLSASKMLEIARLVRARLFQVEHSEFVLAARALGSGQLRVLFTHVLPHALGPALISAALGAGWVVGMEAALAYLGLYPAEAGASWGAAIGQHGQTGGSMPLLAVTFTVLTVLSLARLAEGLEQRLQTRRGPLRNAELSLNA